MTASSIHLPSPDFGRRLFPTLIDERAISHPTKPFAAIPKSSDLHDGFIDISYHQLARAINRCSWWLESKLGKALNFETVGYLGVLDLRYTILMFGCVKVGYKVRIQQTSGFDTIPLTFLTGFLQLTSQQPTGPFNSLGTDGM